ncbi:MAG: phenylacetate--CoA ligase family protein, partial [bacterium]
SRHPKLHAYQAVITHAGYQDNLLVRVEALEGEALVSAIAESVRDVTRLRAEVEVVPPGTIGSDAKKIVDERKWD